MGFGATTCDRLTHPELDSDQSPADFPCASQGSKHSIASVARSVEKASRSTPISIGSAELEECDNSVSKHFFLLDC